MKKDDLKFVLTELKGIKDITDKQEYLVSSAVNQKYNNIILILDKEMERLDTNKIEVNSPAIEFVMLKGSDFNKLQIEINKRIQELMMDNYKIMDFNIMKTPEGIGGYIKYTS